MEKKLMNKYYKLRNIIERTICRWTYKGCDECGMKDFCDEFRSQFAKLFYYDGQLPECEKKDSSIRLSIGIGKYCLRKKDCDNCLARFVCKQLYEIKKLLMSEEGSVERNQNE